MKDIIKNLGPGTQLMMLMLISFLAVFLMQITAFLVVRPIWNVNIFESMDQILLLKDEESIQITKVIHIFTNAGFFLVPALVFKSLFASENKPFFTLQKKQSTEIWIIAVLFFVIALPLINLLHLLNLQLPVSDSVSTDDAKVTEMLSKLLGGTGFESMGINFFVYAIIPAVGEELLFRGVILRQIALSTKKIHLAVWVTAIAFSLVHGEPSLFIPRTMMGAALGYMVIWTGNVWIAVVAHLTNNILTVIIINGILNKTIDPRFDSIGLHPEDVIYLCSSIIITAILIWMIHKKRNSSYPEFIRQYHSEIESRNKQDFEN